MSKITKNLKFFGILFTLGFIFISCMSFLMDNGINGFNAAGLSIFLIIGIMTAFVILKSDETEDNYILDSECIALLEDEPKEEN